MIKTAVCIGIGLAGHQLSPVFDTLEKRLNGRGEAWARIGRYAVGGIMIRLSTRVMLRGRKDVDTVDNALAAGLVSVGAGVAAGYVLDMMTSDLVAPR